MAKKQNLEEHAHELSIEKNGKETVAPGAMLTWALHSHRTQGPASTVSYSSDEGLET